jgi:proteic killer suppression protein
MIRSFRDKDTEKLWTTDANRRFSTIGRPAMRKLYLLHVAKTVGDLRVPPANRLEALKGKLAGRYSIRINDQWRLVFKWEGDGADDVEITDYH